MPLVMIVLCFVLLLPQSFGVLSAVVCFPHPLMPFALPGGVVVVFSR
jgi:hypothetical protein